jgi:four helix bundle protein
VISVTPDFVTIAYVVPMNPTHTDLRKRSRDFSVTVIRLYASLPVSTEAQIIGKQVLRSATSVGAHLHEAHRSRSEAEMISKIEVGMQELEESRYWIQLLAEADIVPGERTEPLLNEIRELMAILVAGVRSLKERKLEQKYR